MAIQGSITIYSRQRHYCGEITPLGNVQFKVTLANPFVFTSDPTASIHQPDQFEVVSQNVYTTDANGVVVIPVSNPPLPDVVSIKLEVLNLPSNKWIPDNTSVNGWQNTNLTLSPLADINRNLSFTMIYRTVQDIYVQSGRKCPQNSSNASKSQTYGAATTKPSQLAKSNSPNLFLLAIATIGGLGIYLFLHHKKGGKK